MARGLMSLKDFIREANKVKGYEASSLSKKEIGPIYSFNKVLRVDPKRSIVEVSMLIKGVTDLITAGNTRRPVAAHRVQLRLNNTINEEVTGAELVKRIRAEHPELGDKTKISNREILENVRRGKEYLKGKVTFETNRVVLETEPEELMHEVEHEDGTITKEYLPNKWKFAIVDKKISPDAKVQVHCSCSSYYWTFQYQNAGANIDLKGSKGKNSYMNYSKSDVKRNPKNQIGMCKHLMLLVGMLMHDNVITEVNRGKNNPGSVFELNMERFKFRKYKTHSAFKQLAEAYKEDLKTKTASRQGGWYSPTKVKNKPKVPRGTRGTKATVPKFGKPPKGYKKGKKK